MSSYAGPRLTLEQAVIVSAFTGVALAPFPAIQRYVEGILGPSRHDPRVRGRGTPEQRAARRVGKLDQRCRTCGAFSAASARCYRCLSNDLEYRIPRPVREAGRAGRTHPPVVPDGRGPRRRPRASPAPMAPTLHRLRPVAVFALWCALILLGSLDDVR